MTAPTVLDNPDYLSPARVAHDMLHLNRLCNLFRAEERAVHFRGVKGFERDGEHAFHVGFMARHINKRACLGLDPDLLARMAECHDFIELYAKDTPMFKDVFRGDDDQPDPRDKKEREEKAYRRLKEEIGHIYPDLIADIRMYMEQGCAEAVFISSFEKLLTVINIFQDDGRSWREYCVPIQEADRRHRTRASKHARVKEWYDYVMNLIWEDAEQRPNFYIEEMPLGQLRRRIANTT